MAERGTDTNLFHAFFTEEHCHDILKLPSCLLLKKETLRQCKLQWSVVMLHSVSGFKSWSYIRILLHLSLSPPFSLSLLYSNQEFQCRGHVWWVTNRREDDSKQSLGSLVRQQKGARRQMPGLWDAQLYDGGLEGRFSVEVEPVLVIFKTQQLSIVSIRKFIW